MHRSETQDLTRCLACDGEISEARERAFSLGDAGVLCFGCAAERGGSYDETHDRWEQAPNLEGLPAPDAERARVWK
ncbi:MAG: hypothetical protein OEZ06_22950 [Myxococcales bacterium]|nr:hypothetical protein [Myxococcales bacterium]